MNYEDYAIPNFIGFENMLKGFKEPRQTYPYYNLIEENNTLGDDTSKFIIQVAVAGFNKKNISATVSNGVLTVAGTVETELKLHYLYKGISTKPFTREFRLNSDVTIKSAIVTDGILEIRLEKSRDKDAVRNIPIL